jgi:tRNA-intron endonuclease
MVEAAYLSGKKALKLVNAKTGRNASFSAVIDMSARLDPSFGEKMAVYEDMKSRGFIVKTGFKYGSHFRAYDSDPEKSHAKYLVHAVSSGYVSAWPEISRAVRLSHGVRKEILFARTAGGRTEYLELKRHIL